MREKRSQRRGREDRGERERTNNIIKRREEKERGKRYKEGEEQGKGKR